MRNVHIVIFIKTVNDIKHSNLSFSLSEHQMKITPSIIKIGGGHLYESKGLSQKRPSLSPRQLKPSEH